MTKYWQLLSDLGPTNHIKQATRGKACLDHILTRGVNSCSTEIFEVPFKTNHKLVSISVGKTTPIQPINVRKLESPSDKVAMMKIPPIDFGDIEIGTNKLIKIIPLIKQNHTFTPIIKIRENWYENSELKLLNESITNKCDPKQKSKLKNRRFNLCRKLKREAITASLKKYGQSTLWRIIKPQNKPITLIIFSITLYLVIQSGRVQE